MKTCTKDTCDRKVRARGLCASHYNQEHQPNRHAKKLMACAYCGTEVLKHPSGATRRPVCSEACRSNLVRRDNAESRPTSTDLVGPVTPRRMKPYPTWQTELPSSSGRFVSGCCAWCGSPFVFEVRGNSRPAIYCTARCAKRMGRAKHKEARGSWWITQHRRYAIYERDNWTCQICKEPVDKTLHHSDNWAASLDHIVPRSRQLVPDHSDDNLRLAHRWCNAVLSDGTYYSEHDLAA